MDIRPIPPRRCPPGVPLRRRFSISNLGPAHFRQVSLGRSQFQAGRISRGLKLRVAFGLRCGTRHAPTGDLPDAHRGTIGGLTRQIGVSRCAELTCLRDRIAKVWGERRQCGCGGPFQISVLFFFCPTAMLLCPVPLFYRAFAFCTTRATATDNGCQIRFVAVVQPPGDAWHRGIVTTAPSPGGCLFLWNGGAPRPLRHVVCLARN